ncbi:hypothetical protein SARC_10026 [Sphaeroforma arctica JP610]|uniref:Hexosyltransferase n=1 Tax=Sphaeroforma arctica JP610 TaxID=667725 RepID=A0A0L0FNC1_9EUKA|nr:hypothetical protein SARC_10026 [Sphaeroforma arctica JP610]KNC77513.1 hypothetical protein SARC_10026 [Sphaeroforma arctica JP610]|eukprot:XP_014151415.1 hypothetical protein SARC_10026 [Sphaeroforma arctica JP610]
MCDSKVPLLVCTFVASTFLIMLTAITMHKESMYSFDLESLGLSGKVNGTALHDWFSELGIPNVNISMPDIPEWASSLGGGLTTFVSWPSGMSSKLNGCNFDECTYGPPYLYFLVPYRNRGKGLQRLVLAMDIDAAQAKTTNAKCVCFGIGDYDDEVSGLTSLEAMEYWKGSHHIASLNGNFSRGGGIERLFKPNSILVTPEEQSILYVMDTDMMVWPGFLDDLILNTQPDMGTVPVCWSLTDYSIRNNKTAGWWRHSGKGMWSIYADKLRKATNMTICGSSSKSWGGEDLGMQKDLRFAKNPARMKRYCNPYLYHLAHPKVSWKDSVDGMGNTEFLAPEKEKWYLETIYNGSLWENYDIGPPLGRCDNFTRMLNNEWALTYR